MFKKINLVLIITMILLLGANSFVLSKQFNGPIPTKFNQSPVLDELVNMGELPSVEERLPEEPYVVEPNESIGEYGGTLNLATLHSSLPLGIAFVIDSFNGFVKPNPEGNESILNFAKAIDVSDDNTTFKIHLRKGVKWSDGHPFTAEDIMFWYEDILLNKELTPSIGNDWKTDGEVIKVEKIDDYTIQFKYNVPRPYFLKYTLAFRSGDITRPKHYLKQFHPKYVTGEALNEKVEKAGYENWRELFQDKNLSYHMVFFNSEVPTLAPYKLIGKTSSRRVYERNPYYWKVDKAGNQLPYIDKVEVSVESDSEVLNGKIISGEVDFNGFCTNLKNYPLYKQYEEKGGYKTILWDSGLGSDLILFINQTIKNENLRKIFQDVRFRRALSLAINRDEINTTIFYGKAKPRQFTVIKTSKYFKREYENAYSEYQPEKAKELLNQIGLKKNNSGFYLRPDGEKLTFTIEYSAAQVSSVISNIELISKQWRDLGIDVQTKQISDELFWERASDNSIDITVWQGDASTDIMFPRLTWFSPTKLGWQWPRWYSWLNTNGKEGEEPPDEVKELQKWWETVLAEEDIEKREILNHKILQSQANNLWIIGTVGEKPHPIIIDKHLKNVPQEGLWCYDTHWTMSRDPEQFYFSVNADERSK